MAGFGFYGWVAIYSMIPACTCSYNIIIIHFEFYKDLSSASSQSVGITVDYNYYVVSERDNARYV